ncbi:GNAT family N-acetyltransferase [Thalassospira lucentensis]|uniref:GNAT family N-acetyltransferase n=1 Tax=Thalassospira lucentensis TaxID=168935 RepID=UPI003D2EDA04
MTLTLLPVTKETVAEYLEFRISVVDATTASYLSRTDQVSMILASTAHHFLLEDDVAVATAAIKRRSDDDCMSVYVLVDPKKRNEKHLTSLIGRLLKTENQPSVEHNTRYHLYPSSGLSFIEADMHAMGFSQVSENIKYVRDPGPPRAGEFPHATKGEQLGYRAMVLDDDLIAKYPDIFSRMANVYDRAFAGRPNVQKITAAEREKYYRQPDSGFVICMLGDDLVASTHFLKLDQEVLTTELECLRKHWGTGAVDLVCKHQVKEIAKRWNLPVIAYADKTNAASRRAMERCGLYPAQEHFSWHRTFLAGSRVDF